MNLQQKRFGEKLGDKWSGWNLTCCILRAVNLLWPHLTLQRGQQPTTLETKDQELRNGAREKLKKMEEAGIIVKEDEPTPWVSSMLVIYKRKVNEKRKDTPPKDGIRICIDPRDLNKALKRPPYPMVTVEEVANRLTRLSFGISPAPELYQREMDRLFE